MWDFERGESPRQFDRGSGGGREQIYVVTGLSDDGRWLCSTNSKYGFADVFVLYGTSDGKTRAVIETGLGSFRCYEALGRFSPTGNYLLAVRQVWDISDEPQRLWECPEQTNSVLDGYLNCAWFPDEEHVLICQDAQYQVWNWRNNEKLLTLFMLPGTRWAAANHQTGHWTGTPLAYRDLRCLLKTAGGKAEWLTPREYEQRTGFERDPSRVGLDFVAQLSRPLAGEPGR